MTRYNPFELKVSLNTNQPNNQPVTHDSLYDH